MTRVLIVEDIAETRNWLTQIAETAFARPHEIDASATVNAGVTAAREKSYDVALIDLGLPDGSGVDVLRALKASSPKILCVVTTVMGDDASIVAALSAGADGYLLKEQPREVLIRQLSHLLDGVPALSPSVAQRIMEHFKHTGPAASSDENLTDRERDVLALISRGMRNLDVARQLSIAESTVAHHIKSIYRKLGISSRAEASWHAARMGLSPGRQEPQ